VTNSHGLRAVMYQRLQNNPKTKAMNRIRGRDIDL